MAAPNWTLTQILNQLNTGNLWFGTQLTYSFPTTSTFMYTGRSGAAGPVADQMRRPALSIISGPFEYFRGSLFGLQR